jgi:hypothetical protein
MIRWRKKTATVVCAIAMSGLVLGPIGCSSPAGKVATHKAKKISPMHDTKAEKAKKDVKKTKEDVKKAID